MKLEFGNVAKKVKSTLSGKSDAAPTPQEEKKQVAGVREAAENLKNALTALRFVDPTGKISQETLEGYKRRVQGFIFKLDQSQTYALDTRALDKKMLYLAQHLGIAMKNGCQETAQRIITGLTYGVVKGHEPVVSSDAERLDEIMEEREKRLGQYKTIVEFSESIDELQKSIDLGQKKFMEKTDEFKKFRDRVKKECDENPHLVKLIDEYGGGVKDLSTQAGAEAFALVTKQNAAKKMFDDLKALKQQCALKEASIVSCRHIIASEENALTDMVHKVEQHLLDEVIVHEEAFRNHLVDLQKQIKVLDELSTRFNDALDEVFSSPEMGDYLISSSEAFKRMEAEITREEAGREEGRRLMQEREQELLNEMENNQGALYNN